MCTTILAALLADVVVGVVGGGFIVAVVVVAVAVVVVVVPQYVCHQKSSRRSQDSLQEFWSGRIPQETTERRGTRCDPEEIQKTAGVQGLASATPRRFLPEKGNRSGIFAASTTLHEPGRTHTSPTTVG